MEARGKGQNCLRLVGHPDADDGVEAVGGGAWAFSNRERQIGRTRAVARDVVDGVGEVERLGEVVAVVQSQDVLALGRQQQQVALRFIGVSVDRNRERRKMDVEGAGTKQRDEQRARP